MFATYMGANRNMSLLCHALLHNCTAAILFVSIEIYIFVIVESYNIETANRPFSCRMNDLARSQRRISLQYGENCELIN